MRVLVTGAEGMLGSDLTTFLAPRHEVFGTDIRHLDIRNLNATRKLVQSLSPDVVVHAAAMTNVDGCEDDPDAAFAVNALATRNIALCATEVGATLVAISTDFVFDGTKAEPYNEYDAVNPVSVYGRSKLAGERLVRQFCPKSSILRTAWLYGKNGWNFVDWVIKTMKEKGRLNIVTDQKGSPTWTMELCHQIETLFTSERFGLYHAAGLGCVNRYDWTLKILELAGMKQGDVQPITSDQLTQKAKRPANSCLDLMALRLEGLCVMRPWEQALMDYINS